jgi:hypothetical protein
MSSRSFDEPADFIFFTSGAAPTTEDFFLSALSGFSGSGDDEREDLSPPYARGGGRRSTSERAHARRYGREAT